MNLPSPAERIEKAFRYFAVYKQTQLKEAYPRKSRTFLLGSRGFFDWHCNAGPGLEGRAFREASVNDCFVDSSGRSGLSRNGLGLTRVNEINTANKATHYKTQSCALFLLTGFMQCRKYRTFKAAAMFLVVRFLLIGTFCGYIPTSVCKHDRAPRACARTVGAREQTTQEKCVRFSVL